MAVRKHSPYYDLKFVVDCNDGMGSPAGFRPIAAFDCKDAAFTYIGCVSNPGRKYQVRERAGDVFRVVTESDAPAPARTLADRPRVPANFAT